MKNAIDEALEDASAEAAFDALSRREQGLAPPDEPAFSEAEIEAIAKLQPAADPGRDAAWQAALAAALKPADLGPTAASVPTRGRGSVSPLRFLTRARITVAASLAMAAGLAVLVVQPYAFDGEAGQAQLSTGDRVLGGAQPTGPSAISLANCVGLDVPLKSSSPLSDSLTAHAYWQRGSQTVRWNIEPQVADHKLTHPCAPLPTGLSAGDWTLVLLVGYPGRLRFLEHDALTQATPGPSSSYRGIHVQRQAVSIASSP